MYRLFSRECARGGGGFGVLATLLIVAGLVLAGVGTFMVFSTFDKSDEDGLSADDVVVEDSNDLSEEEAEEYDDTTVSSDTNGEGGKSPDQALAGHTENRVPEEDGRRDSGEPPVTDGSPYCLSADEEEHFALAKAHLDTISTDKKTIVLESRVEVGVCFDGNTQSSRYMVMDEMYMVTGFITVNGDTGTVTYEEIPSDAPRLTANIREPGEGSVVTLGAEMDLVWEMWGEVYVHMNYATVSWVDDAGQSTQFYDSLIQPFAATNPHKMTVPVRGVAPGSYRLQLTIGQNVPPMDLNQTSFSHIVFATSTTEYAIVVEPGDEEY